MTADLDDYTAVELDTLLVTFDDLVGYCDGVDGTELLVLIAVGNRFLCDFVYVCLFCGCFV